MLPPSLVKEAHRGGFVCAEWELRITRRCLKEDLGRDRDTPFENLLGQEIVKALVGERFDKTESTRQVSPLTTGRKVWVLARGDDHRGGTWYDAQNRVVWLLAYRRHRSGDDADFFPYAKELDEAGSLLPSAEDYEWLFKDRDHRFAAAVRLEAPLILKKARSHPGEHRVMLGGAYGACVAVEVADEVGATSVAFRVETVPKDYVPVILSALHPGAEWELSASMPGRQIDNDEIAFTCVYGSE